MKKTFFLSLLGALSVLTAVQAEYVWTGAVSKDWANQNNWTMTNGSTWNTVANLGPMVPNSNMWDRTIIDGAATNQPTFPSSLEGWTPQLSLINGAQVTTSFKKLQAQSSKPLYFRVDETSKLILSQTGNLQPREGIGSWDISSFEGLTFSNYGLQGGGLSNPTQTFNLDLYGSIKTQRSFTNNLVCNFTGQLGLDISSAEAQANMGQFTLLNTNATFNLITRKLYDSGEASGTSIDFTGSNFINMDGDALTKSGTALTASADDANKFYIYSENNDVFVQYVTETTIPEPSTTSLGLLGVCALLARRRRLA